MVHPCLGAILEGESLLSPVVHDCDAVQVFTPSAFEDSIYG